MQNHNLISLLQACSKTELSSIKLLLKSPYFNNSSNVVKLFNYIVKYYPKFQSKKIKREVIYERIFPNEKFQEDKIMGLARKLEGLIKEFWVVEKFKNDEIEINRIIAKRLKNNKEVWQKHLDNNLKKLKQKTKKDTGYYYKILQNHIDRNKLIEYEGVRSNEPNLQNVIKSLNTVYLVNGLKYLYKTINFQKFKEQNYELSFLEKITDYINNIEDNIVIVKIYQLAINLLLDDNDEKSFDELKSLITDHYQEFSKEEQKNIFYIAKNYCISKINKGKAENKKFIQDLFELCKIEVENKILLENGEMGAATFRNIITVARMAKDIEWLELFLDQHKDTVDKPTYDINLAQLMFEKEDFEDILDLIETTNYKDILFKLYAYSILIQTLYELFNRPHSDDKYMDLLENKIKSFDRWLRRETKKDRLPKHAIHYQNFLALIKKIIKLQSDPDIDISAIQPSLEDEIKSSKTQAKAWLLKKVKEIK